MNLPQHFNCRCIYDFERRQVELAADVERYLIDICTVTPRALLDTRRSFIDYLSKQPYSAIDLAAICRAQAMADLPLPWEAGYEQRVLEDIFANTAQN